MKGFIGVIAKPRRYWKKTQIFRWRVIGSLITTYTVLDVEFVDHGGRVLCMTWVGSDHSYSELHAVDCPEKKKIDPGPRSIVQEVCTRIHIRGLRQTAS